MLKANGNLNLLTLTCLLFRHECEITRAIFEELCMHLFKDTIRCVENAITESGLAKVIVFESSRTFHDNHRCTITCINVANH